MSVFKRREICSVSYTLSYKKDAGTNIKKLGARKQERRTNVRLDFVIEKQVILIGNGTLYSNIQKNTMKCFKLLSFCPPNKLQTA